MVNKDSHYESRAAVFQWTSRFISPASLIVLIIIQLHSMDLHLILHVILRPLSSHGHDCFALSFVVVVKG